LTRFSAEPAENAEILVSLCDLRVLRGGAPHRFSAEFAGNAEILVNPCDLRVLLGDPAHQPRARGQHPEPDVHEGCGRGDETPGFSQKPGALGLLFP